MSASLNPRDLVQGVVRLVSLPEVCIRIGEMLDDPMVSASDLGQVISQDASLTARLLKIVNSAFYGFPSRIETVTRAITIIGMRELRGLVLAASVIEAFGNIPNRLIDMSAFWRHSVYCGVVAQLLARRCHVLHGERLFVAGLLHDIGKLILANRLPGRMQEVQQLMADEAMPASLAERVVLGFDHATVGGALLDAWKMPSSLRESVAFHHSPEEATTDALDVALVHIANIMTGLAEESFDGDELEQLGTVHEHAWRVTGLDAATAREVYTEAGPRFAEALELILPRAQ